MGSKLRLSGRTLDIVRRATVACKACRGGMDVSPNLCGQDGRCKVCYGLQKVCLIPCRCGRPIRLDGEGLVAVVGDDAILCCGRTKCRVALLPQEDFAQVIYTYNTNSYRREIQNPADWEHGGWNSYMYGGTGD